MKTRVCLVVNEKKCQHFCEHEIVSVRIICDRGVSHEIVRHRIASFTQESTRYCNYSKDKFGNELSFINISDGINLDLSMQSNLSKGTISQEDLSNIIHIWENTIYQIEKSYLEMIRLGATPQIARSILPNSLKTEIVVTMNLREWRHFFKLRSSNNAHPQMRQITIPLLKIFKKKLPEIFSDIILI